MTKSRWPDSRRETFYAELHALLTAGLDFSAAFRLLTDGERDTPTRQLLEELHAAVAAGATLWQAMERSGAFRPLEWGVIRIGEQTGRLAETLRFLAEYFRKRAEQRRMLSSAVSYPLVILATAGAAVAFMLSVVVPMFAEVYARMGRGLPALTRSVVALAEAFPACAAAIAALGGGLGALWYANRRNPRVESALATLWLRMPAVGGILRRSHEERVCRLLDLIVSSGIPLLTAVGMLRDAIGFRPYRRSFDLIAQMLERGDSLAAGVSRFPELYDPRLAALVRVGEETGRLPEMLRRRAEALAAELRSAVRRLGTLLEPTLILLVGMLVAVILVAMYMPMFSLGGMLG